MLHFFAVPRAIEGLLVAIFVHLVVGCLEAVAHLACWPEDCVFPLVVQFVARRILILLLHRHCVARHNKQIIIVEFLWILNVVLLLRES